MKRLIALLNDGSYINTFADRMELKDNLILVYWEQDLVVIADISVVLMARMDLVPTAKG